MICLLQASALAGHVGSSAVAGHPLKTCRGMGSLSRTLGLEQTWSGGIHAKHRHTLENSWKTKTLVETNGSLDAQNYLTEEEVL